MSKRKCGNCGKDPAEGFASVWTREAGEVFYCHGDDDDASCYESRQWSSEAPAQPWAGPVAALREGRVRHGLPARPDPDSSEAPA